MAGNRFDELTKELGVAKSRGGFLKTLLGAGVAATAAGALMPALAVHAQVGPGGSCKQTSDCAPPANGCETVSCVHQPPSSGGTGTGTCTVSPVTCPKKNQTCCPSGTSFTCVSGLCK